MPARPLLLLPARARSLARSLVHNTFRKAARAQPNVRRRRDAIAWQRHQRRHRPRCETCFEIDFPAERETEREGRKEGAKEGRQLDDVFAPPATAPRAPTHYHITSYCST